VFLEQQLSPTCLVKNSTQTFTTIRKQWVISWTDRILSFRFLPPGSELSLQYIAWYFFLVVLIFLGHVSKKSFETTLTGT
jgi:hypothetical protein